MRENQQVQLLDAGLPQVRHHVVALPVTGVDQDRGPGCLDERGVGLADVEVPQDDLTVRGARALWAAGEPDAGDRLDGTVGSS